jgi:caffeoyl-CoA O-methyltransferase
MRRGLLVLDNVLQSGRMRLGGLLVLDNVLQGGRVVDLAQAGASVFAIREINDLIAVDERVESVMLPVRDGVTLVRKRG